MPSRNRLGKKKSTLRRREKKYSRKTRKNRGKKAGGPQTKQLVDSLKNLENLLTGEIRDSDYSFNSVNLFRENVIKPISTSRYVAKSPILLQKLNNIYSSNISNETELIIQIGTLVQLLPEIYNIVKIRKEIEDRKAMAYISSHKDLVELKRIIFDRIIPIYLEIASTQKSQRLD
jgi:hypothetical protein